MAWAQQSSSAAWSAPPAQPSQYPPASSPPNAATPAGPNYPPPPGPPMPMHPTHSANYGRPAYPHPGMQPAQYPPSNLPPQQQQQQQQQYPPQYYYGGYPPPGCCGPSMDPQQPGCCGDPAAPCIAPPEQSALGCITQCCDCTTILVCCVAVLSVVAFGLVVGLKDADDIFDAMGVGNGNTLQLQLAIAPNVFLFANGTDPNNSSSCVQSGRLTGSFGRLCMDDSFSAAIFVLNISRWVNFRATLYFIAMMGTLIIAVLLFVVHRQRFPSQPYNPQIGYQPSPPIAFYGTPLYHVFRVVWTVVGFVVFFWICTEMYQYWWFIGYYLNRTSGPLRSFWRKFHVKFIVSMVFVFVFLCWPILNLLLECVCWLIGILPWYVSRMVCSPQLETTRMPPETDLQDIPCCIRLDMFFTECHQGKRLGFSTKLWEILSGTRNAFFDCCDFQSPPPGTYPGGGGPPPPPGSAMQPQGPIRSVAATPERALRSQDEDEVVTSGQLRQQPIGSTSPTPTRGFPAMPPPPPPATSAAATPVQVRSSAAFSAATTSDDEDLRASRSKRKKEKRKNRSDDEGGVEELRKSKEKKKKEKRHKEKKDKKLRESRDDNGGD